MSLKKKFLKGALWNSISQIASQGLNFVFTIILARLLAPKDFGVLAQVSFFIVLLCYFIDFGLATVIMQKKDADEVDCNTAFWGITFFSIAMYTAVFFAAPLIAEFYNNESITLLTRIIFLQFLVMPLSLINEYLEYKSLNYDRIAIAELTGLIISGLISILMAYYGYGVWSLVPLATFISIIRTIIIVALTKWRPKLLFSFARFKELIKLGIHFTYRNLTLYMSENTDYLLIGKLSGASVLGIYNMAFRISNYPFSKIQAILGRMLFPMFNMMGDDIDKMRHNYSRLSYLGGLILIPFLITIYFSIDAFILFFLGTKWMDSTAIVKILVLYLLFSSISFADDPLMMSLNRIKFINSIKTIVTILLLGAGFAATRNYGAIGMAVTFTIVSLFYTLTVKLYLLRQIHVPLMEFFKYIKPLFIYGLIYLVIQLLYSSAIAIVSSSPLLYLAIEGIIFTAFMIIILIHKNILDVKAKKINIDAI